MRYCKIVADGYINAIGISDKVGAEIGEDEYRKISDIIANKPTDAPAGKDYRLTDALVWELYDLPPEEKSTEEQLAEANEALRILGVTV